MSEVLLNVDSTINKVDDLQSQLELCTSGSIICISPVVRDIDVAKTELPETINVEVHDANENIDVLTVELDGCSTSSVATYNTESGTLLERIETCNNCLARKNVKIKPANVRPYDMLDDAQALIDDLNQLVLGKIFAAHDNLDDLNMEIVSYSINVRLNAEIDINQEYLTVEEELSNVKELGESTGKDISSCLDGTEDQINQLPDGYVQQINQCVSDLQEEFKDYLSDRRYKTDVVINTVSHGKLLTPRDLADEAEKQLNELKNIVQGDILVAHDNL
ncbi:unnamed protein product [Tenebrio molitor]|nr:unnamed protein product [Tenebrio molitor]